MYTNWTCLTRCAMHDLRVMHTCNLYLTINCHLVTYLMQYERETVSKGIKFSGSMFHMLIFTDGDWVGDILTRRSRTGYVVFAPGGPLLWQSKLQTTVSISSMQSEYRALYARNTGVEALEREERHLLKSLKIIGVSDEDNP